MNHEEFLCSFFACTLPRSDWTHEAHLRLGWLLLNENEFHSALAIFRERIQEYNNKAGAITGYHETITQAFLMLIFDRIRQRERGTFAEFQTNNEDLFLLKTEKLDRHYSSGLLWSEAAKSEFHEPDLRPLPTVGIIRDAIDRDASSILAIYAPYVERTAISFETDVPTVEEILSRIRKNRALGWLVFEKDGQIAGYASASPHRERAAYQWSCEVSIYVDERYHGLGIATSLYLRLFDSLAKRGYVNVYAGITLPNKKSVALHEALGFRPIGVFTEIGFKHGRWHDVGWWGMKIGNHDQVPSSTRETEESYIENGKTIFTRLYHIRRGYCCQSSAAGCRHCPYR